MQKITMGFEARPRLVRTEGSTFITLHIAPPHNRGGAERPASPQVETKHPSEQTIWHHHPTGEMDSTLAVLIVWLVFYLMAIVGALTEVRPASATLTVAEAADSTPEPAVR